MEKTYKTVQGDMWDAIAYRTMGSCKYTDLLMTANQQHVHTYIFSAGAVLTIPEIPDEYLLPMPPWKRKAK